MGVVEIMGVDDVVVELFEVWIFWYVWCWEMFWGYDDLVEYFGIDLIIYLIVDGDGEIVVFGIIDDIVYYVGKLDLVVYFGFVYLVFDIIEYYGVWWVWGDLFVEMFFKGIVGEFKFFFGIVWLEIVIYWVMYWFVIFIDICVLCIVL